MGTNTGELTLMTDEVVDKFKPSRSALKLGERTGVGSATGVDTELKSSRSRSETSLGRVLLACFGLPSFSYKITDISFIACSV